MTNNLTQGKPSRLIFLFLLPVLAGNIFQQLYNVADSVIVGRFLGVNALAAVGSTGSIVFLVTGMVNGLAGGFSVVLAQKFGAEDYKGLKHFESISIILCLIIGTLMTGGLLLSLKNILRLMNTPQEIFNDTSAYLGILFAGLLITFAYNLMAGMLRALGDSRTPLYFLLLSSVVNVVLDIIFIVSFQMGVAGAAYATVISQLLSAVLCVRHIFKKYKILKLTRTELSFSSSGAWKLLAIGIPMGLQFSITAIGTMVVQAALNGLGPVYIAGFSAAGKIQNFATQAFVALGVALATYTGQNYGAGRADRVKAGVNASIRLSLLFSVICAALIYFFGPYLMRVFISGGNSADMISYGVHYLRIVIWFYPFLSLIFVFRNTLQGLGDGLFPMLGGIFELFARSFVIWLVSSRFGYTGICFADPAAWIMALIPIVPVCFLRMKKLQQRMIEESF